MSQTATRSLGGGHHMAATEVPLLPGHVNVEHRVLVKVAEEATAGMVGVARSMVSVDVAEARTGLALQISIPLPIPTLDDADAIRTGPPLLERVASLQQRLHDRIGHITGRDVARISVTITGAIISEKRRVS